MRTHIGNPVRRAFTLIEILIVVVILGILAAIVIPQFTDASEEAMNSSLRSQLQTVRSQIELYNVQAPGNGWGAFDPLANGWDQLVDNDFLQQAPRNPMQGNSITIAAAAAPGVGWVWDAVNRDLYGVDVDGNQFVE